MEIPAELAEILIDRLGEEPESYAYSEQDLWEQARKLITRYDTPKGRLELMYGVDKLERELDALRSQIWEKLAQYKEDAEGF
jgi:hypothetical protein